MKRNGRYTKLSTDERGNLIIKRTREAISERKRFLDMPIEDALHEMLEDHLCNGLEWIRPEEIGALTDSPILSDDVSRDDQDNITYIGRVWWFPNYAVYSEVEEILKTGKVVFTLAEEEES